MNRTFSFIPSTLIPHHLPCKQSRNFSQLICQHIMACERGENRGDKKKNSSVNRIAFRRLRNSKKKNHINLIYTVNLVKTTCTMFLCCCFSCSGVFSLPCLPVQQNAQAEWGTANGTSGAKLYAISFLNSN